MMRKILPLFAACAMLSTAAYASSAITLSGFGPRVGFSLSPDQLVFGAHAVIGDVAPQTTFDPSIEVGVGDHETSVAFNLDLHYHFALHGSDWKPYAGAGASVTNISTDNPGLTPDNSETDVGGNLILGAGAPTRGGNRFFGELKLGLGNSNLASMKMMVGWNFR